MSVARLPGNHHRGLPCCHRNRPYNHWYHDNDLFDDDSDDNNYHDDVEDYVIAGVILTTIVVNIIILLMMRAIMMSHVKDHVLTGVILTITFHIFTLMTVTIFKDVMITAMI